MYYDSLVHRIPNVKFTIKDDSTIIGKLQDKEAQHSIDNEYNDYTAQPDSIGSILKRYITTSIDVYASNEDFDRNNIVPVIKPVSYLADMDRTTAEMNTKKGFDAVYEPCNDQLIIAYAQDTKTGISYFPEDLFKKSGIAKDSLRSLAIKNLGRLLSSDMQVRGGMVSI